MSFSPSKKRKIVEAIREGKWRYQGDNPEAGCIYWAAATVKHLAAIGTRAVLQAGSMQWPCSAVDDGVNPTHFSYMWEPDSATTRAQLAAGKMPEMHCWAAIPATGEIIDITTRYLVYQAKVRTGLEWTASLPPDFLWEPGAGLAEHRRIIYVADMKAIRVALAMLHASSEGW